MSNTNQSKEATAVSRADFDAKAADLERGKALLERVFDMLPRGHAARDLIARHTGRWLVAFPEVTAALDCGCADQLDCDGRCITPAMRRASAEQKAMAVERWSRALDELLAVKSGPFKGKPQQWFTRAEVIALLDPLAAAVFASQDGAGKRAGTATPSLLSQPRVYLVPTPDYHQGKEGTHRCTCGEYPHTPWCGPWSVLADEASLHPSAAALSSQSEAR